MLSPEVIRKIRTMHIRSRRVVNTVMAGHYRSVFRGMGIEFEEVREYSPGDDVKHIDWKVSARMGRPFIKLYREERERVIMLLVDLSASGWFGTGRMLKRESAAEVASILAFNAIRNNDKVGAILFTDRVERYIPPQKGPAHVWRVIKAFFDFTPRQRNTDIESALAFLGRVTRKRTVSFLISDYLDTGYERPLRLAAKRHEMIAVLLSDPGDFRLPPGGLVTFRDLESAAVLTFDASDRQTRRRYRHQRRREYFNTLEILKAAGIDCVEIDTSTAAADALLRFFLRRERAR
jgi:uncharacterized protein (DUF58 family)